jgi:hypothetical protein
VRETKLEVARLVPAERHPGEVIGPEEDARPAEAPRELRRSCSGVGVSARRTREIFAMCSRTSLNLARARSEGVAFPVMASVPFRASSGIVA